MSNKKSSRHNAPQISLASWIMGGPIVVRPRLRPLPPVLVTTEPLREPKKAESSKPAEKSADNPKDKSGEISKKLVSEAAAPTEKVDEAKTGAMTKDNDNSRSKGDFNNIWTAEQDALLLQLKAVNTSWKDITSQMSLSKSIIQARFKELKKNLTTSTVPPATVPNTENQNNNGNANFTGVNWNQVNGGGGAGFWDNTRLKPDYNWTREDCEILEMLELRYHEEKWLSIQASFYNMTGRMIAADIIEEKLMQGSR